MEFKAKLRNLRISPRKVRLVADAVRKKSVSQALVILDGLDKKSAVPIKKLLESAVANASHTQGALAAQLEVAYIGVNEGVTLKRFRPRAFGRAYTIRKRSSEIVVSLAFSEVAKRRLKKSSKKDTSVDTTSSLKESKKGNAKQSTKQDNKTSK